MNGKFTKIIKKQKTKNHILYSFYKGSFRVFYRQKWFQKIKDFGECL